MESIYKKEDKQLIFRMNEDIDECEVQKIRRKLDNDIERYMPKEIIFDFGFRAGNMHGKTSYRTSQRWITALID